MQLKPGLSVAGPGMQGALDQFRLSPEILGKAQTQLQGGLQVPPIAPWKQKLALLAGGLLNSSPYTQGMAQVPGALMAQESGMDPLTQARKKLEAEQRQRQAMEKLSGMYRDRGAEEAALYADMGEFGPARQAYKGYEDLYQRGPAAGAPETMPGAKGYSKDIAEELLKRDPSGKAYNRYLIRVGSPDPMAQLMMMLQGME